MFGSGIYYMLKLLKKGPEFIEAIDLEPAGHGHFKTPMRPLSAVDESIDQQDSNKEKHHD